MKGGGVAESTKISSSELSSEEANSMAELFQALTSVPPISKPRRKLAGVSPITKCSSVKGNASFSKSLKTKFIN